MGLFDGILNDISRAHGINNNKANAEDEHLKPIDLSQVHPFEGQKNQYDKKDGYPYQGPHPSGGYGGGGNLPPIDKIQSGKQPRRMVRAREGSALKVALILSIIIAIVQLFVDVSFLAAVMVVVVGIEVGLCLTGLSTGQSFEPSMVFFFLFSSASLALLAYCAFAWRPDEIFRILASVFFCIPQIMLIVTWD